MAEAVRLVIWDLDETFWNGTLSEGGIEYNRTNHDLVIALAERGIVSAICSKNDMKTTKAVLAENGIWDFFVFPSIDWNPKGPRIKALIEEIQLRPETVLFIDDNPLNRREAEHFVPGLQVADVDVIPTMLDSPLFKGKNDEKLSRLNQYKLLETRKADEVTATDNVEFLRSCNIQVEIERDVEANIDRAIELINRTNQLNFIKERLPEDLEQARIALKDALSHFSAHAGLVRVTDRYGDYGFCGFFLMTTRRDRARLRQFCFSCRILNMGVERWLYARLGKPRLRIQGEVLADLSDTSEVDWIKEKTAATPALGNAQKEGMAGIFIRGSCNVVPLLHYFRANAETLGEFNEVRQGFSIRTDHSLILRYALEGIGPERMRILEPLGYREEDFQTRFAELDSSWTRILAFWIDAQNLVYRHRRTGTLIPFDIRGSGITRNKRAMLDPDSLEAVALPSHTRDAVRFLSEEFELVDTIPSEEHLKTLDIIFSAVPKGAKVFVLKVPKTTSTAGQLRLDELNARMEAAAQNHRDKVEFVQIPDLADSEGLTGRLHFHRKTYHQLYQAILAKMGDIEETAELRNEGIAAE
jgi:FkbH-like protein